MMSLLSVTCTVVVLLSAGIVPSTNGLLHGFSGMLNSVARPGCAPMVIEDCADMNDVCDMCLREPVFVRA